MKCSIGAIAILLFGLLDCRDCHAAPALRPKTACEICRAQRASCEFSIKREFAACFSDSGAVSPGQQYCILKYFSGMILTYVPDLPFDFLDYFIRECAAAHAQEISPDSELDISDERYFYCSTQADKNVDICLNQYDCS